MATKFILICLLIYNVSFAQYKPLPTQFDSFIVQPKIEWASYSHDYLSFKNYSLNKSLYKRFLKKEIKVSVPVISGTSTANYITYATKENIDKEALYTCCVHPMFDSMGNVTKFDEIHPFEIDTISSTLTDLPQILYIESGILKSYIPWTSPSIVRATTYQTKIFIGYTEYFSTCYNFKYDYLPKESNSNLFLGRFTRHFNMDSVIIQSRLKELYGRTLLETLIPYIENNKLDIFTLDSETKLKPEEISDSILSKINTVPANEDYYDSLQSKYIRYGYPQNYFNLEDFKELQLVQDWYYNYTENIVFNKIKALYLCAKKWRKAGEDKEASPILKIVFK